MYLKKQTITNIEGNIAWLEQQHPLDKQVANHYILDLLKSIVED